MSFGKDRKYTFETWVHQGDMMMETGHPDAAYIYYTRALKEWKRSDGEEAKAYVQQQLKEIGLYEV